MKSVVLFLFAVLLLPRLAFSSQIYGSLRERDRSVGKGVGVEVDCGAGPYSGSTDDYGSYSLYAQREGKCRLKVFYSRQWSRPFEIYSYRDPARYDFDLVQGATEATA